MRNKLTASLILILTIAVLSACASSKDPGYSGVTYPPTDEVVPIFQIKQAPESCRVFAHLFATMPPGMTTSDFATRISEEAKSKGADMMLIGQSRQCTTETSLKFDYYGPAREYRVTEWPGWSFGFAEWGEQGSWATIGYDEWMSSDVRYDYPIVLQVVFLRCQQ